MIRTASLYFPPGNPRKKAVKEAVINGLGAIGITVINGYGGDVGIGWGLSPEMNEVMQRHNAAGQKFFVIDLGYWGRKKPYDARQANYKFSINGLHPTEYMTDSKNKDIPEILPWCEGGDYILVAGMGPKGCKMYGQKHGEWDQHIINTIKKSSKLPIKYRPKPSDREPLRPINAIYAPDKLVRLTTAIRSARCVVTHHGNTALEALALGKPIFCADGPAKLMCSGDIMNFDSPVLPSGRESFFSSLADFNPKYREINNGSFFKYLMKRGLL